ncbi:TolB family protein [Nocardioides astragali]|uniref:TolB family protein n=1 Tax=Nocardioides astragali TaxID=1776736 RepID=A0ABW2MZ41_9ACTN|nr:hypothetical protein [Nocardioides astragali]
MTDELRATLHRIADEATPLPVADDLWQRGRAARRRGQAFAVAAALALVVSVGGIATLTTTDREADTASTEKIEGGAIPSRIEDPGELELESDLAVGRASVAFFSAAGQPVVIGATDGRYHALDLPDLSPDRGPLVLSPDGRHLAWRSNGRIHSADLDDGTATYFPSSEEHAEVTDLRWVPNSSQLLWNGRNEEGEKTGGVLPVGDQAGRPLFPSALRGVPSPNGEVVALASGKTDAAPFLRRRGRRADRELPADLYPGGASIQPLGWAAEDLVVAQAFAGPGADVQGQHLVLFTSPDRPEQEWTYRVITRDVPQNAVPLSIAVDLIPDLDGTSSQQLTHDFGSESGAEEGQGELPYVLGGLVTLLAGLAYIRMLHKQA